MRRVSSAAETIIRRYVFPSGATSITEWEPVNDSGATSLSHGSAASFWHRFSGKRPGAYRHGHVAFARRRIVGRFMCS